MYLVPYGAVFPRKAVDETCAMHVYSEEFPDLHADYILFDSYCANPACDCNNVLLEVVRANSDETLAKVKLSFGEPIHDANPTLDVSQKENPQAQFMLESVADYFEAYPQHIKRLQKHYQELRQAAKNPYHAKHKQVWRLATTDEPVSFTLGRGKKRPRKPKRRR